MAPKILRRFKTMSLELTLTGIFPSKFIFTDAGILNQTFPLCQAAAISISPIPCPKAPTAPRIFAWESVDKAVEPG